MVHSIPSILLLPSMLKHDIAGLCPPNSLVSLARTHTGFQREAEQALYRRISIITSNSKSLRCIQTLATSSEKAGFVRFLAMECTPKETNENRRAMFFLLNALINMHSLCDFRLIMRGDHEVGAWAKDVDKILCGGHFRLQTLLCNRSLDVSRIIKNQTELQILGTYGISETLVETLKQLHTAQVYLPVVLGLERETFLPYYNDITIFPAFYSIDRIPTIPQISVKCFDEAQNFTVRAEVDWVNSFEIYLVDSSDMPSIHALAKNIAVNFPQIFRICFYFERRCEIPSPEMMKIISLFPNLHELGVILWPGVNASPNVSEDVKRARVREWTVACPKLTSVTFIDHSTLLRTPSMSDEWFFSSSILNGAIHGPAYWSVGKSW